MEIDIFDGNLTLEDCAGLPHTIACRGIIQKDDTFLVVTVDKFDITMFPGGRLEENETIEECCVREVLEETGIKCSIKEKSISINEYFEDATWTNVYFKCDFIEDTKITAYTDEEKDLNMTIHWKTLEELMDNYENNMTKHEHGPNIHSREFLALINSL